MSDEKHSISRIEAVISGAEKYIQKHQDDVAPGVGSEEVGIMRSLISALMYTDVKPGDSDQMGRFEFDGAEEIAFHIYEPNGEDPNCLTEILHEEIPTLVAFLRYNFPGLFVASGVTP